MVDVKIKGAKGGGGGSFKQTPDSLRSDDTFEGVLGIAIGPLKGPKRGLKSVKVDGTAIENETGERNLGDFMALIGNGDPALFPQKIQLKLGAGAAPTNVNLEIPNTNVSAPGVWITKTLTNTGANFIDLRFIVNQLYKQTDKGIFEHSLTLDIEMKPVGSATWIDPTAGTPTTTYNETGVDLENGLVRALLPKILFNADGTYKTGNVSTGGSLGSATRTTLGNGYKITGKTTQAAVYELRVAVPNEGTYANKAWDVRVRLREKATIDSSDGKDIQRRIVSWESIAAVYSAVLGTHEDWRGVAWMQVFGKASAQLTGVPEITGEWDTKIVSVPPISVFNPDTRQYTSAIWDGSWAKAFTNDPAWIINDAISDPLSGLSLIAQGSYLNKWDALEASKWCSQLVPDGKGGTHPRYSLNISMAEPQKAEDFIRYLAGAIGGLAWDQGDGEWRLKVDKPELPVDIFTLDNIENEFTYSHTDIDTRYNDITMAFKNAEMDYREDRVRLYDSEHIARYGRKPTTMVAVGCTNRQEAMRRTKLRLESTTGETRIVNFTTNRRGRNVDQLSMILVADGDLGDRANRSTGRTVTVSADRKTITLRDTVRLEVGVAYTLNFSSPNPNYSPETAAQPTNDTWRLPTLAQTRNVTNTTAQRGNVTVLYLDTALPADIPENLSVSLSATNLPTLPKLYRVLNVVPDDNNPERIGISALEVNTDKWDLSDNVSNVDTVFQDMRGATPPPLMPLTGTMLSLIRVPTTTGGDVVTLMGNFQRPSSAFISGFRVVYSVNGGNPIILTERTPFPTFEIVNPAPGTYSVEVRALDRRGQPSEPLTETLIVTQALIDSTMVVYNDGTPIQDLQPAEAGATDGAQVGDNLTNQSGGVIANDSTIMNSAIAILQNGLITGAGGGQVTIGGLGYTGALDADVNLPLAPLGTVAVTKTGNTLVSTVGGYGTGQFSSLMRGASFVSTRIAPGAAFTMVGLDDDTTTFDYSQQTAFTIYNPSTGSFQVYTNGATTGWVVISAPGTGVSGDLELRYDEVEYSVWVGGVKRAAKPATTGLSHYPKFYAYTANTTYTNLRAEYIGVRPRSGATLEDQTGQLLLDAGIKNSAVSITSAGVLTGAGGGTVTYTGIGGGAVGLQTDLRLGGLYLKDSGGTALTDSGTKNSAVSITSAGVLTGAGGGTVTYSGLGGGAVGLQTDLRLGGLYLKDSVGTALTDAATKNSAVSITSAGVLTGAGGGTVTYSGLGGGAVGLQTDLRLGGAYLKDSGGTALTDASTKNSAVSITSAGVLTGAGGGTVTLTGIAPNVDPAATRNRVFNQTTDPGAVEDLAVWRDATIASMPVQRIRVGSVWLDTASFGAKAGVNLIDSTNASLGDANIKNSAVSISSAGVLTGAGGGTVTYSGLGGGAVGLQTDLRLGGAYLKDSAGTGLTDASTKNSAISLTAAGVLTGAGGGTVTITGLGYTGDLAATATAEATVVKNSQFFDYPNATGLATSWSSNGPNMTTANTSRVTGLGSRYSMQVVAAANTFMGAGQIIGSTAVQSIVGNAKYELEADLRLVSGSLAGGQLRVGFYTAAGFSAGADAVLPFDTTADITGSAPGAGTVGAEYSWRKQITAPATAYYFAVYLDTAKDALQAARTYIWRRAAMRGSAEQEIRAAGMETGATLGSKAGLNLKDSTNAVLSDANVKNSAVSISSAGVLTGAGGGTVTFSGLGGGAVGQQADLRLGGAYLKDSGGTGLTDAGTKNSAVSISSAGVLTGAGGGTVTFSGLGGGAVGQQTDLRLGGAYLKDSTGTGLTDTSTKNSAISISSAGVLTGAGGGTVTIAGLGYSGTLDADNTAQSVPYHSQVPADQTINFKADGTAKDGQLPRTLVVKRNRGSVEVTQDNATGWAVNLAGCTATINNTNGSGIKGQITLTGVDSDGYIEVVSTRTSEPTLKDRIPIWKNQDKPAAGGTTGGTGATFFDSAVSGSTTDSAQGSTVIATGNMKSSATGTIVLSGGVYVESAPAASKTTYIKVTLQKSLVGANSWSDVTGLVGLGSSTMAASDAEGGSVQTGFLNLAGTGTGLSNSTDYDVRLVAWRSLGTATTAYVSGIMYGRQS